MQKFLTGRPVGMSCEAFSKRHPGPGRPGWGTAPPLTLHLRLLLHPRIPCSGESAAFLSWEEAGALMETVGLVLRFLGRAGLPRLCLLLLFRLHLHQKTPPPVPQKIYTFCQKSLPTTLSYRTTRQDNPTLPMGWATQLSRWEVTGKCFLLTGEQWESLGFPGNVSHALSESSHFSKPLIRVSLW